MMETNIPFIPDDDPTRNRLQLTMIDLEQHKEWIQSKTGGVEIRDVIYVMGNNDLSIQHLILPTLRRHKIAVFFVIYGAIALWWWLTFYGWWLFP